MDIPKPPVQEAANRPEIVRGTRCGKPVPKSLSGDLSGLQCTLETTDTGHHAGDHRTSHTVHGVGKIKYSWKNKERFRAGTLVVYSGGPPVIDDLAETHNPYLTGEMRKKPECACPPWWKDTGSKMHHSPCRLI